MRAGRRARHSTKDRAKAHARALMAAAAVGAAVTAVAAGAAASATAEGAGAAEDLRAPSLFGWFVIKTSSSQRMPGEMEEPVAAEWRKA